MYPSHRQDSLTPQSGIYACDYSSSTLIASQDCVDDGDYTNGVTTFDDATYFTAGAAYEMGPVAASVTHISSEFQGNSYEATSFGVDYRMAKGLMPYIEITQFNFESNKPKASDVSNTSQLKDNDGYVVLTGLLFSF